MDMHKLSHQNQLLEFRVLRKKKLKHIYLTVNLDGVLIKANEQVSLLKIKKIITSKFFWLLEKKALLEEKKKRNQIQNLAKIFYLGELFEINLMPKEKLFALDVDFKNRKFNISAPFDYSQEKLKNALDRFYKKKAQEKIIPLVFKSSAIMNLRPTEIKFVLAKSKWASCNAKNKLTFNYHLMKLPIDLIEYVVIHELCHISFKNHGKNFWNLVEKYLPDYKKKQKMIREFEKLF